MGRSKPMYRKSSLLSAAERDRINTAAASKANMLISLMVLHDKFGFGEQRLNRFLEEYEKQLIAFNDGYIESVSDFEQVLKDECNIRSGDEIMNAYTQLTLFDWQPEQIKTELKLGTFIDDMNHVGRAFTIDDCKNNIGTIVLLDSSTESHQWFRVVKIINLCRTDDGNRVVCDDGKRGNPCLVDEIFFPEIYEFVP